MTVLVGRRAELVALDAALTGARNGSGGLVLIAGPAGIGKSALADRAASAARGCDMRVLRGHAVDDPGAPPLWPWRRALRQVPGAAGLLDTGGRDVLDPAGRFRVAADVASAVLDHAADGALLLVLEDLHWADDGSLHLLRHLAGELGGSHVAVIGTCRDTTEGPLSTALPELVRGDHVDVLAPGPLTSAHVAEYLAGRPVVTPQDARLVHERTGGNPLLVRLLADHLDSGGSIDTVVRDRPDLRRLVLARAAALDTATRQVVDAAALVGQRVHHGVLVAMTGLSADALDRALTAATAAGVLERRDETGGDVGFAHALVRDALTADLLDRSGPDAVARWHRAAAAALAGVGAPAGPVVMHWQRAGPGHSSQVREWAERADDEARRALAHDEAARFATLAIEAAELDDVDDGELARLWVRLASACVAANRFEDAVGACVRAAGLAERADRSDLLVAAALAVHGVGVGVFGALAPVVERALARTGAADAATRARLLAQLSVGCAETDDIDRARALASDAMAAADAVATDDPDRATAVLEALAARHLAVVDPGSVRERLDLGRRAVELGRGSSSPIAALWGHLWRSAASFQIGNVTEAEREIAEIDRIARDRRSPLARWHHHRFAAMSAALRGDFVAARAANLAAFELGRRVEDISLTGMAYSFGLILAAHRGDPADLVPGWEEVMRHAPPLPIVHIGVPLGRLVEGRHDEARAAFARFRHLPAAMPRGVRWAGTMALVGQVALLLDDADTCAAVFEHFAPLTSDYAGDGSGAVFSHGANAGFAADLARVAGRHETALPLYRVAVTMDERIGARPWAARARHGWAASLLALGHRDDPHGPERADDLLRDAIAEYRRLDMPGPLAAALALVGTSVAEPLLTPRETEVAALVADAMSNREIAARLYLSERTVESHVRNILSKIGGTKRTEVVSWWLRRAR